MGAMCRFTYEKVEAISRLIDVRCGPFIALLVPIEMEDFPRVGPSRKEAKSRGRMAISFCWNKEKNREDYQAARLAL